MSGGYFNPMRGTRRVELEDHYWVQLRHLTTDESNSLGENKEMANGERAKRGMAMAIVEWNVDDADGNVVPITPEAIGKMPQGDFIKLSQVFTEMEGLDEEGQKFMEKARQQAEARFSDSPGQRNSDELARAARSAGVQAAQEPVVESRAQA